MKGACSILICTAFAWIAWVEEPLASCGPQPPRESVVVVPSDGAVDVPAKGKLWVLAGPDYHVTIVWSASGEELVAEKVNGGWFRAALPELSQDTRYEYMVSIIGGIDDDILFGPYSFTTGHGDIAEPVVRIDGSLSLSEPKVWNEGYYPELCESLVSVQSCVDHGDVRLASLPLQVSGAELVAVWTGSNDPDLGCGEHCLYLPAYCGVQLYVDMNQRELADVCVNVMAVSVAGDHTDVETVCGRSENIIGCSVSTGGFGSGRGLQEWFWLVLSLAIILRVLHQRLCGLRSTKTRLDVPKAASRARTTGRGPQEPIRPAS